MNNDNYSLPERIGNIVYHLAMDYSTIYGKTPKDGVMPKYMLLSQDIYNSLNDYLNKAFDIKVTSESRLHGMEIIIVSNKENFISVGNLNCYKFETTDLDKVVGEKLKEVRKGYRINKSLNNTREENK